MGSAVVRACQRDGQEYEILTRDNISLYFDKKCDLLINANGNSKKYMSDRDPLWDFEASVKSVENSLVNINADKYIYLSSCDVYQDCSLPEYTSENQKIEVDKQSNYGFHKYLAEQCVMHYSKQWLIFRMGGFVGQGLKKNAIYDILKGGPLWLHPDSELQFINVDVAADIILRLAKSDLDKAILNLCGQGVIKLSDVINFTNSDISSANNVKKHRYEVDIRKILQFTEIPNTYDSVKEFIEEVKNGYNANSI